MSIKSKVLAAAATLTLVGGVAVTGAVTAGTASAATPSCGPGFVDASTTPVLVQGCLNIFSRQFGTHRSPNFLLDVWRQGAKVGQPIILFRSSNADPAEDFTVSTQGLVSDFNAAGLVSNAVNLHYGNGSSIAQDESAFEIEYSPFGALSGLCVGVSLTAFQGENVSLQPCGVTAKTVWIADTFDFSLPAFFRGFVPLINGSDTNFSHPFVLSYPANGYPTDIPRPVLQTRNLTGFSNGFGPIVGTVVNTQLWSATLGVVP
jgi:hypothetical protein